MNETTKLLTEIAVIYRQVEVKGELLPSDKKVELLKYFKQMMIEYENKLDEMIGGGDIQ